MFKSLKNEEVGFDIKKIRIGIWIDGLGFYSLPRYYFKPLAIKAGRSFMKKTIFLISKPPKKQRYIFSIFSIVLLVLSDLFIKLKYRVSTGFHIKLLEHQWLKLGIC